MSRWQRAIVVGASSGIGRELVRQLAATGCRVVAVARREDRLQELANEFPGLVIPRVHDVRDRAVVPEVFQAACRDLGGLDLIIYAAGVMPSVAADEYPTAKDTEMFEVNTLGAIAWLNEAAARFQGVGAGTIVAISSVAGDRGRAGQPGYNASKAAVTSYTESLRNRLSRHGVTVVTIKPGPVATEMTAGLNLKNAMPVATAARLILAKSRRQGNHYLSPVHAVIFAIIRLLPGAVMRRLKV